MQKWIKKGVIFDYRNTKLKTSHTSIPFADKIREDIYRIYFSGRDDYNRSFISHFEINIHKPENILNVSSTPVLIHGDIGTFDENGVMGSWITTSGQKKILFYIGWNLGVTVPFRNAIGIAISHDGGNTFKKYSKGPIMDRGIFDPCFTASPCVIIDNNIWKMWYLSGIKWEKSGETYKHFYHIKYAESNDGIQWKRKDNKAGIDVSNNGWDSEMICYPFVFKTIGNTFMLYNGSGYGESGIGLAVLDNNQKKYGA